MASQRGVSWLDVSAIEIGSKDEKYELHLMGGDDASFTETVSLACVTLGAQEELEDNIDSEPGRYDIPFWNKRGETIYPYLRIRHVVSGSVSTGIDYAARFEEL